MQTVLKALQGVSLYLETLGFILILIEIKFPRFANLIEKFIDTAGLYFKDTFADALQPIAIFFLGEPLENTENGQSSTDYEEEELFRKDDFQLWFFMILMASHLLIIIPSAIYYIYLRFTSPSSVGSTTDFGLFLLAWTAFVWLAVPFIVSVKFYLLAALIHILNKLANGFALAGLGLIISFIGLLAEISQRF